MRPYRRNRTGPLWQGSTRALAVAMEERGVESESSGKAAAAAMV